MDVVVVGGGVIGCAVARALGMAGLRATLLERDEPGANASWAAAGMLSPLAEADQADAFLSLLLASRQMYPGFVAELLEQTGVDVAYRAEGTLLVALTAEDQQKLEGRYRWQRDADLPVEWLDADAARTAEPQLSPEVRAALRFAGDHQVDNRVLASALWSGAERAGVTMRRGVEAVRLLSSGTRAEGVELASGERIEAEWVVVAGGAWASRLQGLPRSLPVRPVHGQLLALKPREPIFAHVVDSPRGYLVPRNDGRLIVGATVEEIGFRRRITAGGVHTLLAAALEVAPALSGAPLVETWSGHRPGTPDDRPILGPDPDLPNLVYATGHYRNGILLAPITARLLADLIGGRQVSHHLAAFSATRFDPA